MRTQRGDIGGEVVFVLLIDGGHGFTHVVFKIIGLGDNDEMIGEFREFFVFNLPIANQDGAFVGD